MSTARWIKEGRERAKPRPRTKADMYFCPYCGTEREARLIAGESWLSCPARCEDDDCRERMKEYPV